MAVSSKSRTLHFLEHAGQGEGDDLVLHQASDGALAFPPPHLMQYGEPVDSHIASGKYDAATLKRILAESDFDPRKCERFLEFGCSNCRVLRWLYDWTEYAEGWGCDINSNTVLWATQTFPKMNFVVTTTAHILPFPDSYFGLIYAYSILTHIDDLFLTWLAEIWRIMKPGGWFFFTVHDETTLEVLKTKPDFYLSKIILSNKNLPAYESGEAVMLSASRDWRSQVFFRRDWLLRLAGKRFEILSVTERTMAGYQTALLVRKPSL